MFANVGNTNEHKRGKHVVSFAVLLLSLWGIQVSGEADPPATAITSGGYDSAATLGIISNKELLELSGIVAGGVNKDILWVHNDRDNLPRLYALNTKGKTVGTYSLDTFSDSGMMAGDWEDIARVPGSEEGSFDLCVGDIGNNPMIKKEHKILVVAEPRVEPDQSSQVTTVEFKTIRFWFPEDYICNNECLLIHPVTRTIFIVSKAVTKGGKRVKGTRVWSLPPVTDYEVVYTAQLAMDSIPAVDQDKGLVTGGDISSDGHALILRTRESTAYLWELEEGQPLEDVLSGTPNRIALAKTGGGEAICFTLDKSELFTVYDGKKVDRPLHVYRNKK